MTSTENDAIVNGDAGGEDTPDVFSFTSGNSRKHEGSAQMVVHKEAYFYKMDHPKRGIAIIFNHEKFIVPNLRDRSGTQADCDNLKACWERIGFSVTVHQDFGIKALMDEIETLSKIDYSQMDCLVMCVLSHGEEGIIYARDAAYKHESLWEKFTADKCPTLAGKPKLFFIQACQGRRLDPGIALKAEVDGNASAYRIPIHADFLFAYSTIPGFKDSGWFMKALIAELDENAFTYDLLTLLTFVNRRVAVDYESLAPGFYSWRNTSRGSWFIQALCAELRESSFHYDLLTLLTFVNRRVATEFESNTPGDSVMHDKKQIPCITSMLTRLCKFTIKEP